MGRIKDGTAVLVLGIFLLIIAVANPKTGEKTSIQPYKSSVDQRGTDLFTVVDIFKNTEREKGTHHEEKTSIDQREVSSLRKRRLVGRVADTGERKGTVDQEKTSMNQREKSGMIQLINSVKNHFRFHPAVQSGQSAAGTPPSGPSASDLHQTENGIGEDKGTEDPDDTTENLGGLIKKLMSSSRMKRDTDPEFCSHGWYGIKCDMKCPDNCEGNCDRKSGKCFGCKGKGHHGERCDQLCSHCNDNHCHFFDGTCVNGINSSYVQDVDNNTTASGREVVGQNDTWLYVIVVLLLLLLALLLVIHHLLCGFLWIPVCLRSYVPAWYPSRGLIGLYRDFVEKSRVQDKQELGPLPSRNADDLLYNSF